MEDLMIAVLMAALGLSKAEAEAMISKEKIDSGDAKKEFNTKHIAKVTETKEGAKTEGYNKGKGEALTKFEDELKEKFSVKSNKKGLDLVTDVITSKTPDPTKPDSISEDVVKKHPSYIALEKDLTGKLAAAEAETDKKVKEVESKFTAIETNKTVTSTAVSEWKKLNPVLPADAAKQEKQIATFQRELLRQGYDFEVRDVNGSKSILIKYAEGENKGKRVEDAHGHALKFEDFVKTTSDNLGFDYKVADTRSGLGGGNGKGGKKADEQQKDGEEKPKYAGKMPENDDEFVKLITDKSIPLEHRTEIEAFYNKEAESE